MKQRITQCANEHGFAEVRFVSVRPFSDWKQRVPGRPGATLQYDPSGILPGASCIAVLFRPYAPMQDAIYSPYYIESNAGYFAAQVLADALCEQGVTCIANPPLPHRAAALRSGGILGLNQLYIHPAWGTRFSLHLLLLADVAPDADGDMQPCLRCGRCVQACPGQALPIFDHTKCIRYYYESSIMPKALRLHVTRLLGCDICQDCCPHNHAVPYGEPSEHINDAFRIDRLLAGNAKDASRLAGKNFGRPKRLACQSCLLAAANGWGQYLPSIQPLCESEYEALRIYARWAVRALT